MNEMDLLTKIEGLEKAIKEHDDMSVAYKNNLKQVQKELKDYNKPELTPSQLDDIHNAVENAVNDFDFEDTDNYHIEYELDYDGRVNANSLEFQPTYELVEKIVTRVCNLFKEVDCPETDECESTVTKAD
jgi:Tfp pilus assembly pilus retraction ATPase PilT